MTPRAKLMYLKLRYVEIPKILLKAQYLKIKKLFVRHQPAPEMVRLDKSLSV
ncbi:hypothetical protein ACX8XP_07570 [Calditrichota bacterium LG25]